MGTIWIILIVIAICAVVGIGLGWIWNKWLKGKNIIPLADMLTMAAKFFIRQFDFEEKDLVLTVINYVQEAYQTAEDIGSLLTLEEQIDAVLDKARQICLREGLDMDAHPELMDLIEMVTAIIVMFWANSPDEVTSEDVKNLI